LEWTSTGTLTLLSNETQSIYVLETTQELMSRRLLQPFVSDTSTSKPKKRAALQTLSLPEPGGRTHWTGPDARCAAPSLSPRSVAEL
jgi:hypothetical protein